MPSENTVQVPLTQGKFATIDAADAPLVLVHKWCFSRYAVRDRKLCDGPGPKMIAMHRFLLNAPSGVEVDHINGDKLDNRRANLRLATATENKWNFRLHRTNTSGYRGVHWHKASSLWHAEMYVCGRKTSLGYFRSAVDAARAYDAGVKKHRGPFGRLNFP